MVTPVLYGAMVTNVLPPSVAPGIVEYMQRQAGPSSVFMDSVEEVKRFISAEETRGVGFFSAETNGLLVDAFIESGNFGRDLIRLGHVTNGDVAMDMGFPLNSVVIFHPRHLVTRYESGRTIFRDLSSNATAMSEMYATAHPLVGQVTKGNMKKVYAHRPLLVAYFEVNWNREGRKGLGITAMLE